MDPVTILLTLLGLGKTTIEVLKLIVELLEMMEKLESMNEGDFPKLAAGRELAEKALRDILGQSSEAERERIYEQLERDLEEIGCTKKEIDKYIRENHLSGTRAASRAKKKIAMNIAKKVMKKPVKKVAKKKVAKKPVKMKKVAKKKVAKKPVKMKKFAKKKVAKKPVKKSHRRK
jgi:hypothetical protein